MDTIDTLIAQYNALESQKETILRQLYAAMSARKNFHRLQWGDPSQSNKDAWVNCWNMVPSIVDGMVYRKIWLITDVDKGTE